jgi:4-amino-4-deoxy-L-arabinose transferase-like glycosyltransferase
VAGAAAWRIWYVLGPVTDRIHRLAGDEFFYSWQSRYFADGRWFTNPFLLHNQHVSAPTALHPPLYTIFLAIPSALGFDTPTQSRLATALLGTVTVVLIGVLARQIAGDRVGLIAALLAAAYPPLWSNDAVIGLETLYCFLVVVALIAVYRFWRTPRCGAVAIAVPLALASLTRSEGIILFVLSACHGAAHPLVGLERRNSGLGCHGARRHAGDRPVGHPEPHDLRRTDRARHWVRTRARLR